MKKNHCYIFLPSAKFVKSYVNELPTPFFIHTSN